MTSNFINELFSLSGKTALVTGASGYLGRSIAISLAKSGAKVILHGRSKTKINKLVEEFKGKGFEAEPLIFDLTEENETKNHLKKFKISQSTSLLTTLIPGPLALSFRLQLMITEPAMKFH